MKTKGTKMALQKLGDCFVVTESNMRHFEMQVTLVPCAEACDVAVCTNGIGILMCMS